MESMSITWVQFSELDMNTYECLGSISTGSGRLYDPLTSVDSSAGSVESSSQSTSCDQAIVGNFPFGQRPQTVPSIAVQVREQLINEPDRTHHCPPVDVINVVGAFKISPNQSGECPSNVNCISAFAKFCFLSVICYDKLRPLHCQKRIAERKRMQMLNGGAGQASKSTLPQRNTHVFQPGRNSNFD